MTINLQTFPDRGAILESYASRGQSQSGRGFCLYMESAVDKKTDEFGKEITCNICQKDFFGQQRIVSRKVLNRIGSKTGTRFTCLCVNCKSSLVSKISRNATLAIPSIRRSVELLKSGSANQGIVETFRAIQSAKEDVSALVSEKMKELKELTETLNFLSSASCDLRADYAKALWDSYPERRKRACCFISESDLRAMIFSRDGYACVHCGAKSRLSVDHVVAVANGGSNDLENLQTLCISCNSRKGAK